MNFSVNAKELKEAIESLQVKGKNLTNNGFSASNLGSYVYMELNDNTLNLWNGNQTFIVNLTLEVEGTIDGTVVFDGAVVIPYLKNFTEVMFSVKDFILLSDGLKRASVPQVVNHPNMDAIERLSGMVSHVSYQPQPQVLFTFGKSQFEGSFTLTQKDFASCIKACELVKEGIYKLDFNNNVPKFSTRQNVQNKYEEQLTPIFTLGEPATLEFSGPLHSFFKKEQLLNFYVRDEFPLLIVAEDRLLVKAPHVSGD